ncbi:MAG: CDP-alcohol phosphatidyltransferase family protein [Actinobacteria bacterium]|nr:MAG: CDP-alcohol phosphatidyltransferase family protein [Actinomycetota bacterium]
MGLSPPPRGLHTLQEHDPARQRDRPRRLRVAADGPAAHVSRLRVRRHALAVREPQPRQRAGQLLRQSLCSDAESARGGRVDRRARPLRRLPQLVCEGRLGPLARLGLVLGDGHGKPLLARRSRRRLRRSSGARHRLRAAAETHPAKAERRLAARIDRPPIVRRLPRETGATVRNVNRSAAIGSVKQGYTDGTRRLASRYVGRLARTRVSPNALTAGGVLLCTAAAVVIPFEDRNKFLFYWLAAALFIVGSILDILDGALARQSDKATPFGEFLDSLSDRVSEGFVLAAIAFVFARSGDDIAVIFCVAAVAGSFLVSYARAKAELIGLKGDVGIGSRAERVIVISSGLILAPLGVPLQWFIYLLAAAAFLTVLQRILSVRKQLLRKEAHGFDQR